jgi:hypothetical protein
MRRYLATSEIVIESSRLKAYFSRVQVYFFFAGVLDFLLEGLTTVPTLQSLDSGMQEYRLQTDADGPETALHNPLSDDILALAPGTA